MTPGGAVTVLGLDASAGACSAALWRGGTILVRRRLDMGRGHAEALMPMVEAVMAGEGYGALDAVAVTTGPGAFTGLRIGLAAARGLALACAIPAIGVTTFAAVAAAARARAGGRAVAVLIDTKRGDFYARIVSGADEPAVTLAGEVIAAEALAAWLPRGVFVSGDGATAARAALAASGAEPGAIVFDDAPAAPDAAEVATLGAAALIGAQASGAALPPPVPLYLRAPEATPLAQQGKRR